ncbi:MAG: DUF479 domain-containing protein [Desulfatitalea sp.]|nr:DUF479 domain-containing protein [Desulfatitalea sp.]NNK00435.1 DUF479 domain-containing protein [Desulfatitalea sp.]
MNYLAHFFMADIVGGSFTGQFLGDFVKGSAVDDYTPEISTGIRFHRRIDTFSDAHAITRHSRACFTPRRRRFAGVIVDMCYDHFLVNHWQRFNPLPLPVLAQRVYAELSENLGMLPTQAQPMATRMISMDWLGAYAGLDNIAVAIDRIAARLRHGERFMGAIDEVRSNYQLLERDFMTFFPQLVHFSRRYHLPYRESKYA